MSKKDEYWAARDDIESKKTARNKDLTNRYTHMNSGIGQNTPAYEKAKHDTEIGYNSDLVALNEEFGVEPKRGHEDGKAYIDRINNTLSPQEEQNE